MAVQYSRFELVTGYTDNFLLPTRATKDSAGYDFYVAEDTLVKSYTNLFNSLAFTDNAAADIPMSLKEVASTTSAYEARPTLVPTGVKAFMPENFYLQLSVRSSCPLKHWLILANGIGIIDKDYYNNPDNEGHIYFQIINLFPHDIILHKGDKIGQGVFLRYYTTAFDEGVGQQRTGGFGSTSDK